MSDMETFLTKWLKNSNIWYFWIAIFWTFELQYLGFYIFAEKSYLIQQVKIQKFMDPSSSPQPPSSSSSSSSSSTSSRSGGEWSTCLTHDLVDVSLIPSWGKLFSGILSPLTTEACEKSSRWLWKESCVSTGVRKPGNTCASPTAMIWP